MKVARSTASLAVMVLGLVAAAATPATAQFLLDDERGFISANAGYQLPMDSSFAQTASYPYRQEIATVRGDYEVVRASRLDVGGGVMFTKRVGIGVAVSRFQSEATATFSATIPHPTQFNRPETDAFTTPRGIMHEQAAVHLNAVYAAKAGDLIVIKLFGGPSYFRVRQDLIERFDLSETLNLITLAYALEATGTQQQSGEAFGWGFNAGADVSYFLTDHVGIGGLVRFERGSVGMANVLAAAYGGTEAASIPAGGLSGGGGLRIRF